MSIINDIFNQPYFDHAGGIVDESIITSAPMGGSYTELAGEDTPWWQRIMNAGVSVVGDIWGSEPAGGYSSLPGYRASGGGPAAPAGTGISTGVLVMGAAVVLLLLKRRK